MSIVLVPTALFLFLTFFFFSSYCSLLSFSLVDARLTVHMYPRVWRKGKRERDTWIFWLGVPFYFFGSFSPLLCLMRRPKPKCHLSAGRSLWKKRFLRWGGAWLLLPDIRVFRYNNWQMLSDANQADDFPTNKVGKILFFSWETTPLFKDSLSFSPCFYSVCVFSLPC